MRRRAIASGIAIAAASALSGCAIRYDQAGVSRVGIFLWGLGDPPGVHWNLDAPRREIPELPAIEHREMPPREPARVPRGPGAFAPNQSPPDRLTPPIDDNRNRVSRRAPESNVFPVVDPPRDRDDDGTVRR